MFNFNHFHCKNLNEDSISRRNNHYYKLKQHWLTEAHHIRNFGENTQYRSTLKWIIAPELWKNRNNPLKKNSLKKNQEFHSMRQNVCLMTHLKMILYFLLSTS